MKKNKTNMVPVPELKTFNLKKKSRGDFLNYGTGTEGKTAFTLIELIVVITILAILGTIAFIAMSGYSKTARDSTRTSDISRIKSSLELYYINSNKYPDPTNAVPVTYSGGVAWYQGTFGNTTFTNVDRLDKIPKDPLTDKEYTYSVLTNKQEFEIAGISEGDLAQFPLTLFIKWGITPQTNAANKIAWANISGTYNGVSLKVNANSTSYVLAIPSIITSIDLLTLATKETNRKLETIIPSKELVIDGYQNLPNNYIGSLYDSNLETTNSEFIIIKNDDIDNILVYEGNLDNLTPTILITNLQDSYSGTTIQTLVPTHELFNIDIATTPQETIDAYGINFINNNLGGSIETIVYDSCDGLAHNTIKSFYTNNSVPICNTVKTDFTCVNGTWKDGETVLDTGVYPYDTCTTSCVTGFIPVPGNTTFSTTDFCVAKYEMSFSGLTQTDDLGDRNTYSYLDNGDQGVVVSQQGNSPIAEITQPEAIAECTAMGTGYHLITNNEWMTIARNIEQQATNWSSGTIGDGYIYNGISNELTMGCSGTGSTYLPSTTARSTVTGHDICGGKNKLTLSNGEEIWDLSGNVREHVNKANTLDGLDYNLGQTLVGGSSLGTGWDDDGIYTTTDMDIYGSSLYLGTASGMGNLYYADGVASNIFLRGGLSSNASDAGVFTLGLDRTLTDQTAGVGFRCSQ